MGIKRRIKPFALTLIRVGKLLQAWLTVPAYAKRHQLAVRRIRKKPVVAIPHQGVFNANEEVVRTLGIITKELESNGINFFIVPHVNRRLSVAIMSSDRRSVLQLLTRSSMLNGYYAAIEKDQYNTHIPELLSRILRAQNAESILAVSVYRHIASGSRFVLRGESQQVTVEFWSKAEDLPPHLFKRAMDESGIQKQEGMKGALVAPIPNGVAKVFAASEQTFVDYSVGSIKSRTLKIFTRDLLSKVNFPIDIVYTWVDGNDERWRKEYEAARKELEPDFDNNSMSRYTDHEELRYSLRSIEMYASWARNIYIVTDGQVPSWLNTTRDNRVKIVTHESIFSDTSALPVFNSHAIESQLHHIPGLSEHYLYLNDDMLFAGPTTPETFFFPNGVAKVLPSMATIGTGEPSPHESAPSSAGKNARDVVLKKYGVYTTNKYRHAPYPQIKSLAERIEKENGAAVSETMRSKFRDSTNLPFTSVLMQSYLLASGKGVQAPYSTAVINVSSNPSQKITQLIDDGTVLTICLNESITSEEQGEAVARRVKDYLEDTFPFPSKWENADS